MLKPYIMKFLSKVILVLESNLLRIWSWLGLCSSFFLSVRVFDLCLSWVCMCKKVFVTMFGYLWLCMCLCVSMSQMSAEHLFLGLCQFLFLCRLLRVCVCIYAFVYLYLCVCSGSAAAPVACVCLCAATIPLLTSVCCSYKLQLQQAKEWKNVVKM